MTTFGVAMNNKNQGISRGETEVIRTTVHLKTGWCMLKSEFGIVAAGAGTPNKIKTGSIPSKTGGAPGRAMERKR